MRKISLICSLLLCFGSVWAQFEVPTADVIKVFFKTKTCFIIDDNPFSEVNIQLKSAAQKFWELTPFEFISVDEFEKRKKSSTYSFVSVDDVYFDSDKNSTKYKFLCVYLGGNFKTESNMLQLCTIPLAYSEQEENEYAYKIGTLLILAQNHIELVKNNPNLKKSNIIDYYNNNNKGKLQNKTLYLKANEVDKKINNQTAFKQLYPYSFKFVSQDDIEKAIDEKASDVVFLHKVGPGKKHGYHTYEIFLGTADATIYYYDYHTVDENNPDVLLEKEVKKMVKQ